MGKGFWIGGLLGMIVAIAVAVPVVLLFELTGPWPVLVGFVSGSFFTNIGMLVGSNLDDGY
jgi:hypothetical protein